MITTSHLGSGFDLESPDFTKELFNSMFFQPLKEVGGYIALASKEPDSGKFRQHFVADVSLAACLAYDLYLLGRESYFAIHPRCRRSRKRDSVNALTCLHVDVDSNSGAFDKLRQLEPSLIIASGSKHSYHGYFLFDRFLGKEQAGAVESLNKRLLQSVGVKVEAWDIARVLRVPNTANFKSPEHPRAVDVVEWHPQRRYAFEEVCEILGISASDLENKNGTGLDTKSPHETLDQRTRCLNAEDVGYVTQLLDRGLLEPGTRNKAQLLLTRYYYEQRCSAEETSNLIEEFLRARNNGLSRDWQNCPTQVLRNMRAGVAGWFRKARKLYSEPTCKKQKALSRKDRRFIQGRGLTQRDKDFVFDAMTWILNNERYGTIIMCARQMAKFRNCNTRTYQRKLALLYEHGIVELEVEHARNSRLANEYRVLFQFNEPRTITRIRSSPPESAKVDSLILAGMTNSDIRQILPTVSRQRIQFRRQTFDRQAAMSCEERITLPADGLGD